MLHPAPLPMGGLALLRRWRAWAGPASPRRRADTKTAAPAHHRPQANPTGRSCPDASNLAEALDVAQALARHCTIILTMDRYTHVLHEQEVDALSRLPDLHVFPTVVESGKSGTDAS